MVQLILNRVTDASRPASAGSADLLSETALENPHLREAELLHFLRNRRTPGSLLARIGNNTRWTRSYQVQRAIALHPRTPTNTRAQLLSGLHWRDLLEVSTAAFVPPPARRQAELLLLERAPGLAVGEFVSLARRAGRGLVAHMIECCRQAPVIAALAYNPRVTELDLLRLMTLDVPAEVLDVLARHSRWRRHRSLQLALLQHPRTPVAAALASLRRLPAADVAAVADDPRIPRAVRVAAGRLASGEGRALHERPSAILGSREGRERN